MTPAQNPLHHADNERILLGRHLANVASRRAAQPPRAGAIETLSDEKDWLLPVSGIVLLTLAMVSAVIFLP